MDTSWKGRWECAVIQVVVADVQFRVFEVFRGGLYVREGLRAGLLANDSFEVAENIVQGGTGSGVGAPLFVSRPE